MAFQRNKFKNFLSLFKTIQGVSPEEIAVAENFILEERLSEFREDSYDQFLTSPRDFGDWSFNHENYVGNKIKLLHGRGDPETFTDMNRLNWLPDLEPNQMLIRVENLEQLVEVIRYNVDLTQLNDYFSNYIENKDRDSADVIKDFLFHCNRFRDLRPAFVGFWGEVQDLLDKNVTDWANRLRDRFGLGHLDPFNGKPIPVLVFRYRVSDVIQFAKPQNQNFAAIPTVLDSSLSPYFCPTPQGLKEGQTLDLSPGTANDYALNLEILHCYIDYKIDYIYRVGWITEAPGKTCEQARRIHFEYLKDDLKYFDQL
jgi:hypothetical protein